jgi:Uma2 family endonuclease
MTQTLLPPPPATPVPPVAETSAGGFVTSCDWDDYVAIADRLQRHRRVRVTFHKGRMELRVPGKIREALNRMLAEMVAAVLVALGLPYCHGGATTFRRRDLDSGAEPDSSFWIARAEAVRGKEEIDLDRDPPPDLVIEVDVGATSEARMAIWAAMGVGEVWRAFRGGVRFLRLVGGRYEPVETSPTFPFLPAAEVSARLATSPARLDSEILADFRRFLSARVPPPTPNNPVQP